MFKKLKARTSVPLEAANTRHLEHLRKDNLLEFPPDCLHYIKAGFHQHIHLRRQMFFSDALFFLRCNNFRANYFEFGTYQAWTFRQVMLTAQDLGMAEMMFYGFDSFEGFPSLTRNDYSAGYGFDTEAGSRAMSEQDFYALVNHMASGLEKNVRTVKGFYDRSLTPEQAAQIKQQCQSTGKDPRASLVTIDCDLYESARPVLTFIEDFIDQGSVIYMDDYWVGYRGSNKEGVAKAFLEYQKTSRFEFADWGRVGGWGHAFVAQSR